MTFPGRRFYWGVIAVAALLFGYYIYGAFMIFRYGGLSREFGWSAGIENGSWSVIEVDASGPVAGKLEVGDLVLDVTVTPDPRHLVATLPLLAASLAFFAISTVVGVFRPSERNPQLMVEAGFACGAVLLVMCILPSSGFQRGWERILLFVLMLADRGKPRNSERHGTHFPVSRRWPT